MAETETRKHVCITNKNIEKLKKTIKDGKGMVVRGLILSMYEKVSICNKCLDKFKTGFE